MTIACLGWGSLIWDPRDLPTRGIWFPDGPLLPIEFARESDDGRMTLVLVPETAPLVRSLWTLLSVGDLGLAREALRRRECVLSKNAEVQIGQWERGQAGERVGAARRIERWGVSLDLDAVIWTNLSPKFHEQDSVPSSEEVVGHLNALAHEKRKNAERYIRMAPRQIDTNYRRAIERELGWTPLSEM
jgi:hypothetical protein